MAARSYACESDSPMTKRVIPPTYANNSLTAWPLPSWVT